MAVETRAKAIAVRAQFDAGHILQHYGGAVWIAAQNDLAELFRRAETGLRGHGGVERLPFRRRGAADLSSRNLRILRPDRRLHVTGRNLQIRHLIGVDPDAHRIGRAQHLGVANAAQTADRVLQRRSHEVARVILIMDAVIGVDRHHHQEGRCRFGDPQALLLHFLGKQRRRLRQLVLHLHLRDVGVGPLLESQGDRQHTRRIAARRKIAEIVDALELLLNDLGRRAFQRSRVRAGIGRADRHGGRRNFRELRDGKLAERQKSCEHEGDGQDPCKDGPLDKIARHDLTVPRPIPALSVQARAV